MKHQSYIPEEVLYVPAGHLVQGPPSGPLEPLSHSQALAALLPAGEEDRGGQLLHVLEELAPVVEEYVPAGQLTQPPPEVAFCTWVCVCVVCVSSVCLCVSTSRCVCVCARI